MARNHRHHRTTPSAETSWDPVARWYARWAGTQGSDYHTSIAIPTLIDLVRPQPKEVVFDMGCGTGVLASAMHPDVTYVGIDASPRLLAVAKRQHKGHTFIQGDATKLSQAPGLKQGMADVVVFLLSIQDMNPLADVLDSVRWLLKPTGRLGILMFHPCFRVPRQSGWGWDEHRALQYRRVDSYLTPRTIPVRPIAKGKPGSIVAHHLPLEAYINGLVERDFQIRRIAEVPAFPGITRKGKRAKAENRANSEIPLFLGLLASCKQESIPTKSRSRPQILRDSQGNKV